MATYLAYGSNLSIEQMKVRCPDAKVIGKGIMRDWRLLFRQYATIEKCEGFSVPVLVWDLSRNDENSLDRYEGYPKLYDKEIVEIDVTSLDGKEFGTMNGMVYIMTQQAVRLKQAVNCRTSMPSNFYFALLAEAYKMFGFDAKILDDAFCDTISAINL